MQFDLVDFKLIIYIAETNNLTRAAERCFLSVPAASNRIKNIESNLSLKLLERLNHGVTLTEVGEIYLKYALTIYSDIYSLENELAQLSKRLVGKINIVANTTAITEYIVPILSDYLLEFPDTQVNIKDRVSEDIVTILLNKSADIGIISGEIDTKGLATIPLTKGKLILIAPKNHKILLNEAIYLQDTLEYSFITLPEGTAIQMFLYRISEQLNKKTDIRVQVTTYEAICQMVSAGIGIAIIPLSTYQRLKSSYPNLEYINLKDDWANREFKICCHDFNLLSQFSKDFIDYLTKSN